MDIKFIEELFDCLRGTELINSKIESYMDTKVLKIKCKIKNINDDFNIAIDLSHIYNKEQIIFVIKGYLKTEILEHFRLE